jgi:hypothetical protein
LGEWKASIKTPEPWQEEIDFSGSRCSANQCDKPPFAEHAWLKAAHELL